MNDEEIMKKFNESMFQNNNNNQPDIAEKSNANVMNQPSFVNGNNNTSNVESNKNPISEVNQNNNISNGTGEIEKKQNVGPTGSNYYQMPNFADKKNKKKKITITNEVYTAFFIVGAMLLFVFFFPDISRFIKRVFLGITG